MAAPLLTKAAAVAAPRAAAGGRGARLLAGLAAVPFVLVLIAVLVVLGARWEQEAASDGGGQMAPGIGIPAGLVPIYLEAERAHKVNAFLLASVHKHETDFSQYPGTYSVNSSGCAGPMQISSVPGSACGCLWCEDHVRNAYRAGERPDNYPDERQPHPSIYDNFDAIMAAAVILRGKVGGAAIPRLDATAYRALCGYYGACADGVAGNYAHDVLTRAREWQDASRQLGGDLGARGPLPLTPGDRARILRNGLAAAPANAPPAVKQMIAAGNEINGRPYVLGGGHGVPFNVVSASYDCSSAVSYLLGNAGFLTSTLTSLGLMTWGEPGVGRWVTVYADMFEVGHVYMYVAGLRFDTHGAGVDTGPNAGIGWHYGVRARRPGDAIRHPKGL